MQFRTQRGNLLTPCEWKTRFTFTAPLPANKSRPPMTPSGRSWPIAGTRPPIGHLRQRQRIPLHQNLNAELATQTSSATPIPLGSAAPSKTPTASSAATCPKNQPLDYTARDIADLTWAINSTPRKSLGFKTPAEAFSKTSGATLICKSSRY